MLKKNLVKITEETGALYAQNILPGPLVICDSPNLKNGLYLSEPIYPGGVLDLNSYGPEIISRSPALNKAISEGYLDLLTEEDYLIQQRIADERLELQQEEIEKNRVIAEAAGNTYEAEQINLSSTGNAHGNYSTEAILAQQNVAKENKSWVADYKKAKASGLVSGPIEFKELVDSGKLSTRIASGNRGRKISLDDYEQDQIAMTSTRATIANPGNENEINVEKRKLTNFNRTGNLVGAKSIGVIDPENDVYVDDDGMMEEVDLNQSDEEYGNQISIKNNSVSKRLSNRPPYLGKN